MTATRDAAGFRARLLAERWERVLGDPDDPENAFCAARCAELDEREEFPADMCAALDAAGLPTAYVPTRYGGGLAGYDEALAIMRTVARRDLTVAVAHGKTYLGAVCAWVGADPAQAAELAGLIMGGGVVSWGLTERGHGSDLLAGEVTARPTAAGYVLSGEKWLINNATRADRVCTLARTDPAGGPRGFTLLLVDKHRTGRGAGGYRTLPKVLTHGIRGADISGIAFDEAEVPASAAIGPLGSGLEIVLKSLQLTRTLCASLSLGAGDHALRLGLDFLHRRSLYGRTLARLPQARRTLGEAIAGLLAAEAVGVVASRAIHTCTGELATSSAVTKYLVPTLVGESITSIGRLLGARAYLKGTHAQAMFQKVERDHRIVGLFDGSTVVNLHALVNQFGLLSRGYRRGLADEAGSAVAATLTEPLPAFDPGRLSLAPTKGSGLVTGLTSMLKVSALPPATAALAAEVLTATHELHDELASYRPTPLAVPPRAFALAERYAACYAAAAALRLWSHNHRWVAAGAAPHDAALWRDGLWLEACLHRLLARIRPGSARGNPDSDEAFDRLVTVATDRAADAVGPPLSLLPAPARVPDEEGL
ncbi:acyl-CoA dehydrogenase family protein [Streptomyces sp. MK7]|uniref:acyl-CoA dehydrogenase family protein n=1 Tax=Streptomyces sp. MK7 TaxID=3067635 RepID=UPI0029316ABC|nr:acyl-CoA dehydrogenase family protein [Streptomyces sp. MK7]